MKRKKLKFKNPYSLENELCNVLIKFARENGWKVYPETSGWDLLLVKDIQMGVQAKLKDNVEVLAQALSTGTNVRAVLIPVASKKFRKIANTLGIFIIEGLVRKKDALGRRYWAREIKTALDSYSKKHLTYPKNLCWAPDVEINVPAGVKSPRSITEWKIKAIKLCIKLNERGYVTSKDFKDAKLSMTIWKIKWLVDSGKKEGKLVKYTRSAKAKLPDELYPEIVEALYGISKK